MDGNKPEEKLPHKKRGRESSVLSMTDSNYTTMAVLAAELHAGNYELHDRAIKHIIDISLK